MLLKVAVVEPGGPFSVCINADAIVSIEPTDVRPDGGRSAVIYLTNGRRYLTVNDYETLVSSLTKSGLVKN